jgi:hypothetical protein
VETSPFFIFQDPETPWVLTPWRVHSPGFCVFYRGTLKTGKNSLPQSPQVCYKIAGITVADIHPLRHTFCSQLARRNVPVQKMITPDGRLDIETAMVYFIMVREELAGALRSSERVRRLIPPMLRQASPVIFYPVSI